MTGTRSCPTLSEGVRLLPLYQWVLSSQPPLSCMVLWTAQLDLWVRWLWLAETGEGGLGKYQRASHSFPGNSQLFYLKKSNLLFPLAFSCLRVCWGKWDWVGAGCSCLLTSCIPSSEEKGRLSLPGFISFLRPLPLVPFGGPRDGFRGSKISSYCSQACDFVGKVSSSKAFYSVPS